MAAYQYIYVMKGLGEKEGSISARFVTSFNTSKHEVAQVLSIIKRADSITKPKL